MLKDLLVKADVEANLLEDVAGKAILEADLWEDVVCKGLVCKASIEDVLCEAVGDKDVVSKLLLKASLLQAILLEEGLQAPSAKLKLCKIQADILVLKAVKVKAASWFWEVIC